jgi:MOSC domain-containing protein YiiM
MQRANRCVSCEPGRGVNFGVYAGVVAEGVVRVGDPLRVPVVEPHLPT